MAQTDSSESIENDKRLQIRKFQYFREFSENSIKQQINEVIETGNAMQSNSLNPAQLIYNIIL